MKVHICDLCESIIKNRKDMKILKIKKRDLDYDWVSNSIVESWRTDTHTLCPQCFKHMIEFIENMREVDKEIAAKDA